MSGDVEQIGTPRGPARVTWHRAAAPRGLLLLGHGAGGGIGAPDLVAATGAATVAGFDVGLVEQPYRVAGRRAPAPAGHLDQAWEAVVAAVRGDLPLLQGGRSSGARVACRTAAATGAVAVLCLAFPLHPPGRPERTRLPELDGAGVPVLVVQGRSDRFGIPDEGSGRSVVLIDGDHGLKKDPTGLAGAVRGWLAGLEL
ncbi:alpha/beta family hydrolase [Pseudonocardia sp. NPDC049635]|uniref:alpha/beta hydrolase family protein n=1 Tax=Pseudonocardia sp. NPDC049635 TaxID=3155506 RepID=UPI0033CF2559